MKKIEFIHVFTGVMMMLLWSNLNNQTASATSDVIEPRIKTATVLSSYVDVYSLCEYMYRKNEVYKDLTYINYYTESERTTTWKELSDGIRECFVNIEYDTK